MGLIMATGYSGQGMDHFLTAGTEALLRLMPL